jgi:uncharacterized membrane protein YfhO
MIPISFNVNVKRTLALLENISKNIKDITPGLRANEKLVLSFFQDNLTAQKNPDGSTYEDLKTVYVKSKAYRQRIRLSPKPLDTVFYRAEIKAKSENNKMSILSEHPGIWTHENGLEIKIFKTGILFEFPKRSSIWLSNSQLYRLSENLGQRLIAFNG